MLPMKKNLSVAEFNEIAREEASPEKLIEVCSHIDIYSCYEPIFYPPKEQEDEWRRLRGEYALDPTLENTSFYVTEPDGTEYFYCGDTRIKVTEHFSGNGRQFDTLIEDVISHIANTATKISVAC